MPRLMIGNILEQRCWHSDCYPSDLISKFVFVLCGSEHLKLFGKCPRACGSWIRTLHWFGGNTILRSQPRGRSAAGISQCGVMKREGDGFHQCCSAASVPDETKQFWLQKEQTNSRPLVRKEPGAWLSLSGGRHNKTFFFLFFFAKRLSGFHFVRPHCSLPPVLHLPTLPAKRDKLLHLPTLSQWPYIQLYNLCNGAFTAAHQCMVPSLLEPNSWQWDDSSLSSSVNCKLSTFWSTIFI